MSGVWYCRYWRGHAPRIQRHPPLGEHPLVHRMDEAQLQQHPFCRDHRFTPWNLLHGPAPVRLLAPFQPHGLHPGDPAVIAQEPWVPMAQSRSPSSSCEVKVLSFSGRCDQVSPLFPALAAWAAAPVTPPSARPAAVPCRHSWRRCRRRRAFEIFLYLYRRNIERPWRAVVIFPNPRVVLGEAVALSALAARGCTPALISVGPACRVQVRTTRDLASTTPN